MADVNVENKYVNVQRAVFSYLINTIGLNVAAACGVLANIQGESYPSFNPNSHGDLDKKTNVYMSYGLCQWYDTRRDKLFSRSNTKTPSVSQQVDYLNYELNSTFVGVRNALKNVPNTAQGAYEAADVFCRQFEIPAEVNLRAAERSKWARDNYFPYYSGNPTSVTAVKDIATKIVKAARSVVGKNYAEGKKVTDDSGGGADSSGLVHYSYNTGGYTNEDGDGLAEATVAGYYSSFKDRTAIKESEVAAADLLFYMNTAGTHVEYMAIANGSGGRIYGKPGTAKITEESGLGKPYAIRRLLTRAQTSVNNESTNSDATTAANYVNLTSYDQYAAIMQTNLTNVKAAGFDYGYLIDVTNGGEFKFYIPEFSEHAGASWSPINIRGRSVSVMAYEKTDSRQISVSLELYAGEGLYKGSSLEDSVDKLHKDAFFVKSLEYPDYSNPIVRPPAAVHLILGSAINILGVVSGVNVEHLKPLDEQRRSMYIKLSFTVTQIAVNPIDYRNVRDGQYAILDTQNPDTMSGDGSNTNVPASPDTNNENTTTNSNTKVYCFIGDSRFVGMEGAIGSKDNTTFIAKVSEGNSWYNSNVDKINNLDKSAHIIYGLGVNDLNSSKCVSNLKDLIDKGFKNVYFANVTPVDESKIREYGYTRTNEEIKRYNSSVSSNLPTGVKIIDGYSYMMTNSYSTADGLHYTSETYKNWYKYIINSLGGSR